MPSWDNENMEGQSFKTGEKEKFRQTKKYAVGRILAIHIVIGT